MKMIVAMNGNDISSSISRFIFLFSNRLISRHETQEHTHLYREANNDLSSQHDANQSSFDVSE